MKTWGKKMILCFQSELKHAVMKAFGSYWADRSHGSHHQNMGSCVWLSDASGSCWDRSQNLVGGGCRKSWTAALVGSGTRTSRETSTISFCTSGTEQMFHVRHRVCESVDQNSCLMVKTCRVSDWLETPDLLLSVKYCLHQTHWFEQQSLNLTNY